MGVKAEQLSRLRGHRAICKLLGSELIINYADTPYLRFAVRTRQYIYRKIFCTINFAALKLFAKSKSIFFMNLYNYIQFS